jgi:hypothetical protein
MISLRRAKGSEGRTNAITLGARGTSPLKKPEENMRTPLSMAALSTLVADVERYKKKGTKMKHAAKKKNAFNKKNRNGRKRKWRRWWRTTRAFRKK